MWTFGWDAVLVSDPTFFQNYRIRSLQQRSADPFSYGLTEGISQLYLTGRGDRSYFDVRAIHYTGFSEADVQSALPVIHPVLDYSRTLATPVFGGELGYSVNLTSLSRASADFDPITNSAVLNTVLRAGDGGPGRQDSRNCLLRGIPGDYTRLSAESHWRRQIIDTFGQIWTPFASVRADVANVNIAIGSGRLEFHHAGRKSDQRGSCRRSVSSIAIRSSACSHGAPRRSSRSAQLIIRPSEQRNQRLPNEDAQSLVYDDTNLFKVDKFSGWDRTEGGGRLNAGLQYTAQFNRGGSVQRAVRPIVSVVRRKLVCARRPHEYRSRFRPRHQPRRLCRASRRISRTRSTASSRASGSTKADFTLRRLEIEGRANFDRWGVSVLYGNYDAQPQLGFLNRREGILGTGSVKVDTNWVVTGAARYDIDATKFDQLRFGVGYIDDCFIMSINYITDYTYSGNVQTNHSVMFQVSLRTLGGSGSQ